MKCVIAIGIGVLLATFAAGPAAGQAGATAGAAQNAPTPAPAPGSPAIFRANADLQAALSKAVAAGGAVVAAPVTVTDQYRANLIRRTEPNGAITHPGNTEMHYIIEGAGTIVTGGTVVRKDGAPATIEGGVARQVVNGDIIIIPAGSAHMYSEIIEPITYLEFRFVAPH